MKRLVLAFSLLLPLAACDSGPGGTSGEKGGRAEGEVLGGAISDDMIPLEQLRSEAPLAPPEGPVPSEVDAQQPDVTPMEGVEGAAPGTAADAAPAAPAGDQPQE